MAKETPKAQKLPVEEEKKKERLNRMMDEIIHDLEDIAAAAMNMKPGHRRSVDSRDKCVAKQAII